MPSIAVLDIKPNFMRHSCSTLLFIGVLWGLTACGGNPPASQASSEAPAAEAGETAAANPDDRGVGPIKEVKLGNPLDAQLVEGGQQVYDLKCASCHRLTDERLVGPGWKDVTKRRKPEWIMNFTVNVEEMLSKDSEAIAMLEQCLVRMPNQNVSEADARAIVEFMRKNDGEK
jgi:mono/diheme cytochrome c family protein